MHPLWKAPFLQLRNPPPQEDRDLPTGEGMEMQDDPPQGEPQGTTGGVSSPIRKEEEDMLNEPQTQVTTTMENLAVGSPSDTMKSQSETHL